MKAFVVFDDEKPDDMAQCKKMLQVDDWIAVVDSIANHVRSQLKYGHGHQSANEALEEMRDWIAEELTDRQLSLY